MKRLILHGSILIVALYSFGAWLNPYREMVQQGNQLYQQEKYDDAAQRYIEAAGVYDPESPELRLNLGNSLYASGDYIRAASEYAKVIGTGKSSMDAMGLYGLGNSKFQQQDYVAAIDSYEKALSLTPDDEDIKYNLEVARIKLKELIDQNKDQAEQQQSQDQQKQDQQQQQDQEQQGDQQQQQEQQQQSGDQSKDQQKQDQAQSEDGKQDNQDMNAGATPTPQEVGGDKQDEQDENQKAKAAGKEQNQDEREEGQMSMQDVDRFLDAMERDEKQRRAERVMQQNSQYSVERDW